MPNRINTIQVMDQISLYFFNCETKLSISDKIKAIIINLRTGMVCNIRFISPII